MEPTFSAGDSYIFKRDGTVIFDQSTPAGTKYIPIVSSGSVVLQILSLDTTDEGT